MNREQFIAWLILEGWEGAAHRDWYTAVKKVDMSRFWVLLQPDGVHDVELSAGYRFDPGCDLHTDTVPLQELPDILFAKVAEELGVEYEP